jgi:molecular chaperone DnaK
LIEAGAQSAGGRRCRVLGKAGMDMGGTSIDSWLFQEVLRRNNLSDLDDDVRQVGQALLVACEEAKERLSFHEQAHISVLAPESGRLLTAELTRPQFEELLDAHDAFSGIDRTIRRALNAARERGYAEEDIKAALMVGGSSQIPAVQRTLRRIFGRERVMLDRPLDAVARGAAAFVAGVDFYDHIQHDYAIRWTNPRTGRHEYRTLVKRGTPYPTMEPVAELTIKATYDGQTQLGIAIFELGEARRGVDAQPLELVFDPSGGVRVMPISAADIERRGRFWMNEHNPTFLSLAAPVERGQRCFDVSFSIDGNKRLLITARDLTTGLLSHKDYPVVKLT